MKERDTHERRWGYLMSAAVAVAAFGCGNAARPPTSAPPPPPPAAAGLLTAADVRSIVETAAASVNLPLTIAVTDRSGTLLALYSKAGAPATSVANFGAPASSEDLAVALARSAALFSSDATPISTRTIRFISASHFPPGIPLTASGPLYGIESTNRGCGFNAAFLSGQSLPVLTALGGGPGLGIVTGKPDLLDSDNLAVNPGGVPVYKTGRAVGGIGVAGADPATVEFAAVAGTVGNGFAPVVPSPGAVFLNGFALPFVAQTTRPAGEMPGAADGSYALSPQAAPGPVPEGDLIAETGSNQAGLSLVQVQSMVQNTVATANRTRAALRLPEGSRARFSIAVADLNGDLLALYRMPDATMFSADVAVAKARNVVYFSSATGELAGLPPGTAVTTRTIGFAAQPLFPSGVDETSPGPFFDLLQYDAANPCTEGRQPRNANQNGVVFFPGSAPLYMNGKLVGGLGVSGDGVDQDDYAAAAGAKGFEPSDSIRADQFIVREVRLPYQKFPRDPED